jgi:hypothetical protein
MGGLLDLHRPVWCVEWLVYKLVMPIGVAVFRDFFLSVKLYK